MKNKESILFFSQHGEDCLLWEYFDYKEKGFFIDVGAFDGKYLSNTFSFEQQGWTGLCVEPHPDYFALCKENRPSSICVNMACVGDEKDQVMLKVDPAGLYSGLADDPDRKEYVEKIFENNDLQFGAFQDVPVKAATLNSLMEAHFSERQSIDFLSIDVEGTEIDVLKGFDLDRFAPEVIVVEANSSEEQSNVKQYLGDKGYFFARIIGVNLIFVNSESGSRKIQDIVVRCDIEKQEHPLNSNYSVKNISEGLRVDDFANLKQNLQKKYEKMLRLRDEKIALQGKVKLLTADNEKLVAENEAYCKQLRNKYDTLHAQYGKLAEQHEQLIRKHNRLMAAYEELVTHFCVKFVLKIRGLLKKARK